MSLDVYLTMPNAVTSNRSGIFIRENGETKEISREEWDRRHPSKELVTYTQSEGNKVHWGNITHNLNRMAQEAGIYKVLWRPEELNITKARQLIKPLVDGLLLLEDEPERFYSLNPENGWGTYEGLRKFVREYLIACINYPDADVSVSR